MSTDGPITIGGKHFTPRRETYDVLLAREDMDEREGAAVDEANGLTAEFRHLQQRMLNLAEADEFDDAERDRIKARLAELRKASRKAARELFMIRIESLAERLDPSPEVDWLLKNLDEQTLEEVTEALNGVRPTSRDPESDGS